MNPKQRKKKDQLELIWCSGLLKKIGGFSPERAAEAIRADPARAELLNLLLLSIHQLVAPERQRALFERPLQGQPFFGASLAEVVFWDDPLHAILRATHVLSKMGSGDTHPENRLL